jgi:excinuclease UvrABC ATPase subunit
MSAHIINIAPEIEAAIHAGQLTKIEITEARMKLADGVFTINAKDLLTPKTKTAVEGEQPKSTKERQREFVKRKKDAGFKKDWLHHSIQELAEQAGGQEKIAVSVDRLLIRAEAAERRADAAEAEVRRLKARRWWRFWH